MSVVSEYLKEHPDVVFGLVIVVLAMMIAAVVLSSFTLYRVDEVLDDLKHRGGSGSATNANYVNPGGGGWNRRDAHGCRPDIGERWCPLEQMCKIGPCLTPTPGVQSSTGSHGSHGSHGSNGSNGILGGQGLAAPSAAPAVVAGGLDASGVPTLDATSAKQMLASPQPAVIIVYSNGCGHCRTLKTKLAGLAQSGWLANKRVGMLEYAELKKDGGLQKLLNTTSVPALFKVHRGSVKDVKRGDMQLDALKLFIQ